MLAERCAFAPGVGVAGTLLVSALCTFAACSSSYSTTDTAQDAGLDDAGTALDGSSSGGKDGGVAPDAAQTADSGVPRGTHIFSKSFGGVDEDYMTRANVDLSGNLLLAGTFADTLDFGGGALTSQGANDIYFAKLDPTGKYVFAKTFGDAAEQDGINMVGTGSGDLYAVGVFTGTVALTSGSATAPDSDFDSLIVRFGSDGTTKDTLVITGTGRQFVNGLAYDGSRGVFFTGFNTGASAGSTMLTSNGGNDFIAGHINSTQNWSSDYGDTSEQFGNDVAYDPGGSIVAVGYFGGTLNFNDGTPHASAGGYDAFVARLSAGGIPIWSRSFGAAGDQQANFVKLDASGEILVFGTFTGSMTIGNDLTSAGAGDVFLAKLAADGTPMWSKHFGGAADESAGGLAIAPNGDILICGKTNGDLDFGLGALAPAGDADGFVARLDKNGTAIWARRFGDAAFQSVSGVGVTLTNEVWIAGYFTGSIDLGGGPFTSKGKHDLFVARFTP